MSRSSSSSSSVHDLSFTSLFRILAFILGTWILWQISDILLYCFIAILLAGVIYPLANWGLRYRIPKIVTVLCVYLGLLGVLALILTLLVPALIEQSKALVNVYGVYLGGATNLLQDIDIFQQIQRNGLNFASGFGGIPSQVQAFFGNAFSVIVDIFGGIAGFVIVLVLALYMVIEDSAIKKIFHQWVPKEYQEFASRLVSLVMEKLGGWMRGQLLLCLIIGLLYMVVFLALGVPYWLLLAVLGGLFEFVPYVGPILSAIPAVFLAFTVSPALGLATLIALVIVQQLENNLIVPKIMQHTVGLNPIISILAFLIGAKLFGIIGAIVAIPVALAISVVLIEWRDFRSLALRRE